MVSDSFIVFVWLFGFFSILYVIILHLSLYLSRKWIEYKMVVAKTIVQYILNFYKYSVLQKKGFMKIDQGWNQPMFNEVWYLPLFSKHCENVGIIRRIWKEPIYIAKVLICFNKDIYFSGNGAKSHGYHLRKSMVIPPNERFFEKNKRLKCYKPLVYDCYRIIGDWDGVIPSYQTLEVELMADYIYHRKSLKGEIKKIRFNIFLDYISWLFKEKNIILQHNLKQHKK